MCNWLLLTGIPYTSKIALDDVVIKTEGCRSSESDDTAGGGFAPGAGELVFI